MEIHRLDQCQIRLPRRALVEAEKILRQYWRANGWVWPEAITVVMLRPTAMKKLNFQWRKKNKTTDVLTFRIEQQAEIFFDCAKVKKQAIQWGGSFKSEMLFLFVHALLHWQGFDHETPEQRRAMFSLQDQLFARVCRKLGLRNLPVNYSLLREDEVRLDRC